MNTKTYRPTHATNAWFTLAASDVQGKTLTITDVFGTVHVGVMEWLTGSDLHMNGQDINLHNVSTITISF